MLLHEKVNFAHGDMWVLTLAHSVTYVPLTVRPWYGLTFEYERTSNSGDKRDQSAGGLRLLRYSY
jgi:hypothetical protein